MTLVKYSPGKISLLEMSPHILILQNILSCVNWTNEHYAGKSLFTGWDLANHAFHRFTNIVESVELFLKEHPSAVESCVCRQRLIFDGCCRLDFGSQFVVCVLVLPMQYRPLRTGTGLKLGLNFLMFWWQRWQVVILMQFMVLCVFSRVSWHTICSM